MQGGEPGREIQGGEKGRVKAESGEEGRENAGWEGEICSSWRMGRENAGWGGVSGC